jgi:hypothetical protein
MENFLIVCGNNKKFELLDLAKYVYMKDSAFYNSCNISIILNATTNDFSLVDFDFKKTFYEPKIFDNHINIIINKIQNKEIKFYRSDKLINEDFILYYNDYLYKLTENANFVDKISLNTQKKKQEKKNYLKKFDNIISNNNQIDSSQILHNFKAIEPYFLRLAEIENKHVLYSFGTQLTNRTSIIQYYYSNTLNPKNFNQLLADESEIINFIHKYFSSLAAELPYKKTDFIFRKNEFKYIPETEEIIKIEEKPIDINLYKNSEKVNSKMVKKHVPRKNFISSKNINKIKTIRVPLRNGNSFVETYGKSLNDAREYGASISYYVKDDPKEANEIKSGIYKVEFSNYKNAIINILVSDEHLEVHELASEDRNIYCPNMGGDALPLNDGEILEIENSSFKLFKNSFSDYYNQDK